MGGKWVGSLEGGGGEEGGDGPGGVGEVVGEVGVCVEGFGKGACWLGLDMAG